VSAQLRFFIVPGSHKAPGHAVLPEDSMGGTVLYNRQLKNSGATKGILISGNWKVKWFKCEMHRGLADCGQFLALALRLGRLICRHGTDDLPSKPARDDVRVDLFAALY
jgi:hypothetical protein